MVIFESVRFKNLLSFGNYWTEIKLNANQNTLIIGSNGSGKSTMLDALCFGLFGKAFRSVNKPTLVNTINKRECCVEIIFTANNKSYKIIRGIKPNIFEIYQDDILLNQDSSVKDYQEILEKFILKFNYKSFTQIVILGSASFTPFMQLSTSDRRLIIEDLLDIQIFSSMNSVVKGKISSNKDNITDKKYQISLCDQKHEMKKKHLQSLQQDYKGRINKCEDEIQKTTEHINTITLEINDLSLKSTELQSKIVDRLSIEENINKLSRIETKVETNIALKKKMTTFYESNDSCPTCKQNIDRDFKSSTVNALVADLEDLNAGMVKLKDKLTKEKSIILDINDKQSQLHKIQLKISSNNSVIREGNGYIKKLQDQIAEIKNISGATDHDKQELDDISAELLRLKSDLESLIEDKQYYDAAVLLLKDSGIKTKIIKQYLPIINKLVNKYLSLLDFFINFNLDESFKETIKSRHRDDFTYNNFSEGEKTKINLSILFAWREVARIKNSAHTNLLILDEIFDSSLDDIGVDYLLTILHQMENINIHVISHKGDMLNDKFDKVVRFNKVKNFSKIKK